MRSNALLLACCLFAAPALGQSLAGRTGTGVAAGQEFPAEQPVPTVAVAAGAVAAAILGAVIATHAAHENPASAASTTTVTTTTR